MNQTIYILRHGQTFWNKENRIQSHSNGEGNLLTKEGFKEAEKIARILKEINFDYSFYTPLRRTKQTLEKILEFHPKLKPHMDNRIREISLSFLAGLSQIQWESDYPKTKLIFNERKNNRFNCKIPEDIDFSDCYNRSLQIAKENGEIGKKIPPWENYSELFERTRPFTKELEQLGNSNILIVGHLGVNRSIIGNIIREYINKIVLHKLAVYKFPHGSIMKIEKSHDNVKVYYYENNSWSEFLI